jgi:hypothetical protein
MAKKAKNGVENGKAVEKEKVKPVELTSISVVVWPEWTGSRVQREIRYGDGVHKFSFGLPVPATDEEFIRLYNKGTSTFQHLGVLKRSYDADSLLRDVLKTALAAGKPAASLSGEVRLRIEADMPIMETEAVKSEAAQLKAAKASLGLSLAEMAALAQKALAAGMKATSEEPPASE